MKMLSILDQRTKLPGYCKYKIHRLKVKALSIFDVYNFLYFKYLIKVKGYSKLPIKDNIRNGIFEIFKKSVDGRDVVLKIPKRNTKDSYKLYLRIKNSFRDYSDTLLSLKDIPFLSDNTAELVKIYKHGGYKSVFVKGYNLKELRDAIMYDNLNPKQSLALRISVQIEKLTKNLESHNEKFGFIPGDWPLHNLVYDEESDKIINVDLEGFYSYKKNNLENDLLFIKNELQDVYNLLDEDNKDEQIIVGKVLSVVKYTSTRSETYAAKGFDAAYHSLKIKDRYFKGQRECESRFENLDYDFSDKNILDLGCNTGGMLHTLSDKIKFGVGVDFSTKCINAANLIKNTNQVDNLAFYNFNLETESLTMIKNFLPFKKVDICFLLAVCMWIKNWREVIEFCLEISENLLFETNGTKKEQEEQLEFLRVRYSKLVLLNSQSNDDPLQKNRKLYLCKT